MCEFMGGGEYTFLEMELRMNCPSVLWLLPHGYIPDSLGTVVLKKKKNPGGIVSAFPTIKQTLESLGRSGEIKKTHMGSRRKKSKQVL